MRQHHARLSLLCLSLAACSSAPAGDSPAAPSGSDTTQSASVGAAGTAAKPPAAGSGVTSSTAGARAPTSAAGAQSTTSTAAAGSGGGAPSTAAAAGSNSATAGQTASAEPSAGASAPSAGASGGASAPTAGAASALPPITDAGAKGPFEIAVQESLEGLDTHILIAPKDLGRDGIKHPIVVWINGAGTGSTGYRNMLDNVAAHGFFLLDDKQSTFEVPPEVEAQRVAIGWAIEQADKQGGPYFGKLDTSRIAIAGHSLGSVSTFGNLSDMRIKTSIHMAGGVTGNPQGVDETWLQDLHVPAMFLVGDRDSNGLQRVKDDYAQAPTTFPVFFGLLAGVSHTDEFTQPNGGRWGRILISWLRWQLADDPSFAKAFEGASCEFCTGDWTAQKHAID
jgi:hypothetical protein